MQAVQTSGVPTLPTAPSLLKVCWTSLWCLEALQRTTQTQSRRHESLPLFPPVLFLCARQDVHFFQHFNKQCTVAKAAAGRLMRLLGRWRSIKWNVCQNFVLCFLKFLCFNFSFLKIGSFSLFCPLLSATLFTSKHYFQQVVLLCDTLSVNPTWADFVQSYDLTSFAAMPLPGNLF